MRRAGALALVAGALAAGLAVCSYAVFQAQSALESGRDRPLAGAGRALLATGDDWELRRALRRFEEARPEGAPPAEALERNARAEAALAAIVEAGGDPARVALAANLRGVLFAEDARLDPASAPRFAQLALESFRRAVLADPGNDDAKANLELLVELLAHGRGAIGAESGSQGATGAGASPEGSGY